MLMPVSVCGALKLPIVFHFPLSLALVRSLVILAGMTDKFSTILQAITFNADGLVPVIAQDHHSGEVLMMAWMNRVALTETLTTGTMCYYSRSRKGLWRKGESSGQTQTLVEMTIDCDGDTLLAKVHQTGVACHTGRRSCFFNTIDGDALRINQEVVIPPEKLYP